MQVLFAAGLPKVIRVTTISAHQGHPRKAIVKTEVGSVMRAAAVVGSGPVRVCSLGTGFIVLWSQSVAGSGVRWWRQCWAGPKLAGKPVEVGRGGLISRQN
jgi:hypothetical protein